LADYALGLKSPPPRRKTPPLLPELIKIREDRILTQADLMQIGTFATNGIIAGICKTQDHCEGQILRQGYP
jgi:hypothetical protein